MTTSEPTTGEIVRDLRLKTKYGMELMKGHFSEKDFVTTIAADRLESQEQKIAALTARAEQAENKLRELKGCL